MVATRDYIPAGENLTDLERSRLNRHAAIRTGANHADYIPADDLGPAPSGNAQEKADRALNAAIARAEVATKVDFDRALERLKLWNVPQATDALEKMPSAVLRMYLVAEESVAARSGILKNFPNPGDEVREQYAPQLLPDVPEPQAADSGPEAPQAEATVEE